MRIREGILKHPLILKPQEREGNYNFRLAPYATRSFANVFGGEWCLLMVAALQMIGETYPHPDRLQVFEYGDRKFWAIADFMEGETASDFIGIEKLYVMFLLPEDY